MKCNVRELAQLSDQPCAMEGRLNYKRISHGGYRNQAVFKERWFRLINNYLFYFKISEMGKFDTKNPAGVFVMENSSIQMEHGQNIPFSFSISFIDEPEKRHMFAARAEDNVVQWVIKLRECSYEYLRNRLHTLQSRIYSMTGKDPLLMVPRNEGACLWAPAIPFSTTPACTVNTNSFSCHLHTNGAFSLERSKSDVQAHRRFHSKNTTFYTDEAKDDASKQGFALERSNTSAFSGSVSNFDKKTTFYTDREAKEDASKQGFALERSKTSAFSGSVNNFDKSIFDNRPTYSRAAPSPPVRTKMSPSSKRVEMNNEVKMLTEQYLATTSILDSAPVPPRRRISPKNIDVNTEATRPLQDSSEDLIKF